MIRFRLKELLADKSFKEGRRIEWQEVSENAGIHRTTLSRMVNVRGHNATVSNLDSLCRYFDCQLGELAVYVPDPDTNANAEKAVGVSKKMKPEPGRTGPQTSRARPVK